MRAPRVVAGSFEGLDAWVVPRSGGGYDAVVSMFGRGVTAIRAESEVTLVHT